MFAWRALPTRADASPGAYLTVPALHGAGIRVAFTTRSGGYSGDPYRSLNLSFVSGDDPDTVRANRARALEAVGARPESWTSGRQVHATGVHRAGAGDGGRGAFSPDTTIPETDALWTDEPRVALAVLTADCLPIVLADPERRRVGVVHAGWRGLIAGVVERATAAMGGRDLIAAVGPAIGPCCYEVGPEVADEASRALDTSVVRRDDGIRLDLWRGALIALRRAGVSCIAPAALCTRCEPHRFYSHRAGDAGRQGVLAMIAGDA